MNQVLKTSILLLFILTLTLFSKISAQSKMRINLNDGSTLEFFIDDIQKLTFDLVTAIQNHPKITKQLLKIKAFPNPAKDQVVLEYSLSGEAEVVIEIFTMQGVLVERLNIGIRHQGDHQHTLNTQQLVSGPYICRVWQNNEVVSTKIIVKQ
jgi:hypothetical protein